MCKTGLTPSSPWLFTIQSATEQDGRSANLFLHNSVQVRVTLMPATCVGQQILGNLPHIMSVNICARGTFACLFSCRPCAVHNMQVIVDLTYFISATSSCISIYCMPFCHITTPLHTSVMGWDNNRN
jgi:hypothetical protein